ncbi:unnamed protein product [Closterium sp. NIES-64]|nr:unnamed protein product [Closterium sp. NIES-64]
MLLVVLCTGCGCEVAASTLSDGSLQALVATISVPPRLTTPTQPTSSQRSHPPNVLSSHHPPPSLTTLLCPPPVLPHCRRTPHQVVNRVQKLRKRAGLEPSDAVEAFIHVHGGDGADGTHGENGKEGGDGAEESALHRILAAQLRSLFFAPPRCPPFRPVPTTPPGGVHSGSIGGAATLCPLLPLPCRVWTSKVNPCALCTYTPPRLSFHPVPHGEQVVLASERYSGVAGATFTLTLTRPALCFSPSLTADLCHGEAAAATAVQVALMARDPAKLKAEIAGAGGKVRRDRLPPSLHLPFPAPPPGDAAAATAVQVALMARDPAKLKAGDGRCRRQGEQP